jgi:hypothetical protein
VTRDNKIIIIIIIIIIILFYFLVSSTYFKVVRLLTPGFLQCISLKLILMNCIIYSTIFNPLNNVPSLSSSTFRFISFIPFSHFTVYSIKSLSIFLYSLISAQFLGQIVNGTE